MKRAPNRFDLSLYDEFTLIVQRKTQFSPPTPLQKGTGFLRPQGICLTRKRWARESVFVHVEDVWLHRERGKRHVQNERQGRRQTHEERTTQRGFATLFIDSINNIGCLSLEPRASSLYPSASGDQLSEQLPFESAPRFPHESFL